MEFIFFFISAIAILLLIVLYQRLRLTAKELFISKKLLEEEISSRITAEAELKDYREKHPGEALNIPEETTAGAESNYQAEEKIDETEQLKRDLAREKKNRQELIEINNRYQLAIEATENGFVDWFMDGSNIYFSPILSRHLGYTPKELNEKALHWKDYIHIEDINSVNEAVNGILSGTAKSAEFTHRILTSSGHWKWFLTKIKMAGNDFPDDLARLFIVTEDISLRKKAEEEMLINLAKEQELAEMRSRLVTLVSHEFRTPISTILSSAEIIENYGERLTKEKSAGYFDKIKKSVEYLVSLLNEISLMSKTEASILLFKPEKAEMVSLFQSIIDELKVSYTAHPKIHFNSNRKQFFADYDIKLFRYIFSNLLSNAIKYTEPDKNIYVYSILNQDEIFFSVTDEGMGIPKEEQKGLFYPFMRASNVGEIKGSGLGLSIVKKTIEVCRGKISFESELNKGTSFKVILPLASNNKES
jgi:PAS domain S-box-containing protein